MIAGIHRPERIPENERLDIQAIVKEINTKGTDAEYIVKIDDIISRLSELLKPGDVVLGMSNGGFGGFYQALLC